MTRSAMAYRVRFNLGAKNRRRFVARRWLLDCQGSFLKSDLKLPLPHHGESSHLAPYVGRSRAKAGTTRFFRIYSYTACTCTTPTPHHHRRFFVKPDMSLLEILKKLLALVQALTLRFQVIYADRGLYSTNIVKYLQTIKQPAVLVCPIRGKQGSTRALCRGRKSYRTRYPSPVAP